jgi:hypothetical protein
MPFIFIIVVELGSKSKGKLIHIKSEYQLKYAALSN